MESEIKETIWSLKADKAPEPDGFTIKFYRDAWDIIKGDLKKILIGQEERTRFVEPPTLHFSH